MFFFCLRPGGTRASPPSAYIYYYNNIIHDIFTRLSFRSGLERIVFHLQNKYIIVTNAGIKQIGVHYIVRVRSPSRRKMFDTNVAPTAGAGGDVVFEK